MDDVPWNFFKVIKSKEIGLIRSIKFNPSGMYCMTGGNDKAIRLWNPVKGLLMKSYVGHGQDVLSVVASHDSSKLASGSKDQVVMIWDVVSGHALRRMREHYGAVNCVEFNPEESSVVVSGSNDSRCLIWDIRSRSSKPLQILDEAKDSIMSIYVAGHGIITSSVDFNLRIYDIRMGKLTSDCMGHPLSCCRMSQDRLSVLCGCLDSQIRLVDKDTGSVLNTYKGHKNCNYKVESDIICNDSLVVSGSEDGRLLFWDFITANIVKETVAHDSAVISSSYSSKTNLLLTASSESIVLWVGNKVPTE